MIFNQIYNFLGASKNKSLGIGILCLEACFALIASCFGMQLFTMILVAIGAFMYLHQGGFLLRQEGFPDGYQEKDNLWRIPKYSVLRLVVMLGCWIEDAIWNFCKAPYCLFKLCTQHEKNPAESMGQYGAIGSAVGTLFAAGCGTFLLLNPFTTLPFIATIVGVILVGAICAKSFEYLGRKKAIPQYENYLKKELQKKIKEDRVVKKIKKQQNLANPCILQYKINNRDVSPETHYLVTLSPENSFMVYYRNDASTEFKLVLSKSEYKAVQGVEHNSKAYERFVVNLEKLNTSKKFYLYKPVQLSTEEAELLGLFHHGFSNDSAKDHEEKTLQTPVVSQEETKETDALLNPLTTQDILSKLRNDMFNPRKNNTLKMSQEHGTLKKMAQEFKDMRTGLDQLAVRGQYSGLRSFSDAVHSSEDPTTGVSNVLLCYLQTP